MQTFISSSANFNLLPSSLLFFNEINCHLEHIVLKMLEPSNGLFFATMRGHFWNIIKSCIFMCVGFMILMYIFMPLWAHTFALKFSLWDKKALLKIFPWNHQLSDLNKFLKIIHEEKKNFKDVLCIMRRKKNLQKMR